MTKVQGMIVPKISEFSITKIFNNLMNNKELSEWYTSIATRDRYLNKVIEQFEKTDINYRIVVKKPRYFSNLFDTDITNNYFNTNINKASLVKIINDTEKSIQSTETTSTDESKENIINKVRQYKNEVKKWIENNIEKDLHTKQLKDGLNTPTVVEEVSPPPPLPQGSTDAATSQPSSTTPTTPGPGTLPRQPSQQLLQFNY